MCPEYSFGAFAVPLCAEDESVTLWFDGGFGLQVIRHYNLLDGTHFDVCREFGVTQFLAGTFSFFVSEEIEAHQCEC